MKKIVTYERLRELFSYDPETGHFTRLIDCGSAKAGARAGCKVGQGYIEITIGGRAHKAHRLAWLYMTGAWPTKDIDHKDTVKCNNAWENLREATKAQNSANCVARSSNTSGFKGVFYEKHKDRWRARIEVSGRRFHLGYFRTKEQAFAAYCAAAEKHCGEFARVA